MKVKICGITTLEAGETAVNFGADAIGFVFAKSKRKISKEKAKAIAEKLPEDVIKVGIFVNESAQEIENIAKMVGLTHIQLHGDETEAFSRELSLPVIKAVSFEGNESLSAYQTYPCEYLLLDSPKGKYRGGNGTTFDWGKVDLRCLEGKKIILAGGLHSGNVEQAIRTIKPSMVDVSSGVETEGQKDLDKIRSFIEKAKAAYRGIEDEYLHTSK